MLILQKELKFSQKKIIKVNDKNAKINSTMMIKMEKKLFHPQSMNQKNTKMYFSYIKSMQFSRDSDLQKIDLFLDKLNNNNNNYFPK